MIVVNLFGAPGAGKSTGAAYIFAKLKMAGINAELVTEFAKDKVWEENAEVFKNQAYIFGKQSFRLSRLKDKVDVIVTDSPLLLCEYYNNQPELGDEFEKTVQNVFMSYDNMIYFLQRVKPYNPKGRFQTEEESDEIAEDLFSFVYDRAYDLRFNFDELPGCIESYDKIVEDVCERLKGEKNE